MTSQLNVDAIVDKAGSGGTNVKIGNTSTYVSDGGNVTQNTVQGLAKAWSNNNMQGTPAFNDSFNFSSITDTATGRQKNTVSNNMTNDDYAGGGIAPVASTGTAYSSSMMTEQQTTSFFSFMSVYVGGSVQTIHDFPNVGLIIQGDLA